MLHRVLHIFQFPDCYSDFNLFNHFEGFNQDNLLNVDQSRFEDNFGYNGQKSQTIPHSENLSKEDGEEIMDPEEESYNNIVTDGELASMNIKDLNRKLKERGIPKDTIEKLKQRRRTLKNRKYATE